MTSTLTLDTRLSARADLLASDLSETELVMMNIDAGKYYGVEGVAKVIWEFLNESRSVSEVCAHVCENFDIEAATAESDTLEFLNQLVSEGLVQVAGEAGD